LYEQILKDLQSAGNAGEYYTPRPLIKTIIKVVAPEIGQTIYDGAVGSAGFLCEAFDYLMNSRKLTTTDITTLQKKTFYGKEKKSLAYIIGTMNMILHGIDAPNIVHTNTLGENIADIQEKDRFDIVLANPPFGGKERTEVQQNFPIRSGETAYLFLQHFIRSLKTGGRAAIVIKNTFLSNGDAASLRQELLETCDVHTILDCPAGVFTGTGVKTVVLFFTKGKSTRSIWYYQLNLGRKLGKTKPLNDADLAEFGILQPKREVSENSWLIEIDFETESQNLDLTPKNPNKVLTSDSRSSQEILDALQKLDKESSHFIERIKALL
jgi:type I restriction enzyme M protein